MTTLVADLAVGLLFLAGGGILWRRRPADRMWVLMVATAVAWLLGGVLHRGPFHPAAGHRTERSVRKPHRDGLRRIRLRRRRRRVLHGGPARDGGLGARAGRARGGSDSRSRPVRSAASGSAPNTRRWSIVEVVLAATAADLGGARASDLTLALYELGLALTAIGLTVDALWGGWSQQALTGLVVELGDRDAAGTLRDRLADALGDRSLQLGYWAPAARPVRGRRGRPTPAARRWVPATRDDDRFAHGQPVAVLVHDAAVLADPRLVDAVATAARISMVPPRLQADIVARIDDIEALPTTARRVRRAPAVARGPRDQRGPGGQPRARPVVARRAAC